MTGKHELYTKIHYTKTMLLTGFLKSTIGTLFISLGAGLLVYNYVQPSNYAAHTPYVGVILILFGFLSYFIGDWYKMKKKNEEFEHIDTHIEEKCSEHLKEKAIEVVEELYKKEQLKADAAVEKKLQRLKEY
jgi:hypothetical protein